MSAPAFHYPVPRRPLNLALRSVATGAERRERTRVLCPLHERPSLQPAPLLLAWSRASLACYRGTWKSRTQEALHDFQHRHQGVRQEQTTGASFRPQVRLL